MVRNLVLPADRPHLPNLERVPPGDSYSGETAWKAKLEVVVNGVASTPVSITVE